MALATRPDPALQPHHQRRWQPSRCQCQFRIRSQWGCGDECSCRRAARAAFGATYALFGSADLRAAMASLPAPAKPVTAGNTAQVVPFTNETKAG